MELQIAKWLIVNDNVIEGNSIPGALRSAPAKITADELYRMLGYNYPKFFKMDVLCKWAWLGAEILLADVQIATRSKVAVVLATSSGCLDIDKRYNETLATVPSPAMFVYTLPNIMLGEIAIRHGLKGEQLCMIQERYTPEDIHFHVTDLLQNRGMDACLCGYVDAVGDSKTICLYWVGKENGRLFDVENMQLIFDQLS